LLQSRQPSEVGHSTHYFSLEPSFEEYPSLKTNPGSHLVQVKVLEHSMQPLYVHSGHVLLLASQNPGLHCSQTFPWVDRQVEQFATSHIPHKFEFTKANASVSVEPSVTEDWI